MKRVALILLFFIFFQHIVSAEPIVFSHKNKFGLKNGQTIITEPEYKKLVRLGSSSWIMQDGTKFGIIDDNGNIITPAVYNQAERILGKYVKFRKGSKYCLLDENGKDVINKNDKNIGYYSSIDLLYGGLIVTSINHKYGLNSFNGNTKLDNIFDDIYMPDKDTIVLVYGTKVMDFKRQDDNYNPFSFVFVNLENEDITLSDLANNPIAMTGYYGITFTDYLLKFISSISPAYEQTIDELMFSQGADTVSVLMKFSWLPKFPFVYLKNYYSDVVNPTIGPLNKAKKSLRQQIKN